MAPRARAAFRCYQVLKVLVGCFEVGGKGGRGFAFYLGVSPIIAMVMLNMEINAWIGNKYYENRILFLPVQSSFEPVLSQAAQLGIYF